MDQAVIPFDWARMFLGDQPPLFMAEVIFRTVLIYSYTLLLIRWIGGRSIAQLSIVEFLLVIALGSAVGDPLFYPDVPLLHAMVVITVVVLINKGLDFLILRSKRVQHGLDGVPKRLIGDGRMFMETLDRGGLQTVELFEQLRLAGISNLGEVAHAFVETNGRVSVFRRPSPQPGLPIVPPPEISPLETVEAPAGKARTAPLCCAHCGALAAPVDTVCRFCDSDKFTPARLPVDQQEG